MSQDKRNRQRENRLKRLEAERKAARAKALRRRIIQVVILFVIVVIALGINSLLGGDDETTTDTTTAAPATTAGVEESTTTVTSEPTDTTTVVALPADYDGYRALPVACGGTLPDPVEPMTFDAPEDQGLNPDDTVVATIVTSCGDIVLELDPAAAPETVNSFVFLAREGYYDGQAFHRIVEGFMLQGGDQSATGTGNPGYLLADELDITDALYPKGTLAMGNSGSPGTAGSQFFITFEDYSLTPSYSVFGKTVDSDATMDAIEALPKEFRGGEQSVPMEGLFIERIDIEVAASS